MKNTKSPLPEEMDHIEGDSNINDNSQEIDLDNPMLHTIDNDSMVDDSNGFDSSQAGSNATQGVTPMHRQNIDESRVDEVLVEDNLDDSNYPDIVDIADRDAAEYSNRND